MLLHPTQIFIKPPICDFIPSKSQATNTIFASNQISFMKNFSKFALFGILTLLSSAIFAPSTRAQYLHVPKMDGTSITYQLLNTSNVYFNTPTQGNLGSQLDTTSNATVLIVQLTNLLKGKVNADTFTPLAVNVSGKISFSARVLKCTGTCTITCQPVESIDGIGEWYPIPGLSAVVLTPSSLTVGLRTDWNYYVATGIPILTSSRHYGVQFTGIASTTMAIQAWMKLIPDK